MQQQRPSVSPQDDPIACHVASLAEARALLLQCQDDCDYSINSQA